MSQTGELRAMTPRETVLEAAGQLTAARVIRHVPNTRSSFLEVLVELRTAVQEEIDRNARLLVAHGATWVEIGNALGVSRQAAWDRYGPQA